MAMMTYNESQRRLLRLQPLAYHLQVANVPVFMSRNHECKQSKKDCAVRNSANA